MIRLWVSGTRGSDMAQWGDAGSYDGGIYGDSMESEGHYIIFDYGSTNFY